jgi:FtsH-binding integral membrane protein
MLARVMNTAFFYGLVLALANIVLSLVSYFLGFQTDRIAQEQWFGLLGFVVMVVVLWLGIRATREEAKDGSLSYGRGVGGGTLVSLYAGLIGMVYTFIHLTFIHPSYVDYRIDVARQKWIQLGLKDAQIEASEKVLRFVYAPVPFSILTLLMTVFFGVVIALVVAAFLKRGPAASPPPPPL